MPRTFLCGHNLVISLLAMLLWLAGCNEAPKSPEPPRADQHPKELTIHGHTRVDPYYWLRERDNPKVIEYLEAENAYADAVMQHTKSLQEKLYNEMVGRIKQDDASVPYRLRGYYYYTRYEEGKEYPIYCRKKGSLDSQEEILLDVNALATRHAFYQVREVTVSPNNMILAFGADSVSRRRYGIRFKDLRTGDFLPDQLAETSGGVAWANDNRTVFYAVKDTVTLRPYKIMRHVLGTPASDDQVVFQENDETFNAFVFKSKSERYILIGSWQTLSTEYRFLDADRPDGDLKVIQPRVRGLEYSVEHFGNDFYIRTNDRDAKNFKLVRAPVSAPGRANWRDVLPHRADVLLENFEIFRDYLVVHERKNGLPQLRIIRWRDRSEHYLDFGEPTYSAYISVNPEFDTKILRYGYSSLTTPNSIYDYNMETREKTLMKQDEVLGNFLPDHYASERLYARAADGVEVPISLVYRKEIDLREPQPLLLYGYGSYGASMNPSFSSVRLSLLDRGFIFAIAHIRGGEEMGRQWYEDGKLLKKKNTFTDFIACAEYLIAEGYTAPDRLFAQGGSAGGLLMGAVANMRPDLFRGIIAAVPWVDVVTTMLDPNIPLTTSEYDEWGNPNDKTYYDYMLSYSPYDNVTAQDYPAMIITTGLHDSQVQYWEPAKWVAKLRAMKTDNNPLILKTDMESGHGGASGRFKRFRTTAMQYAFLLDLAGIQE